MLLNIGFTVVQTNDGKNVLGPNGEVEVEKASMKAKFEADELHKLNGGNGLLKCYYCEKVVTGKERIS